MTRGKPTESLNDIIEADTLAELLRLLELGIPLVHATVAAGLAGRTVDLWLARGKAGEEPFVELFDVADRARARGRASLYARMREHADRDTRACAWLLDHAAMQEQRAVTTERARVALERDRLELEQLRLDLQPLEDVAGW